MAEPADIWLIRHGETEWSRSGSHTGRTDIPLTETGEAQARTLVPYLAGKKFALVLTSPLRRARDTCNLAGYGDSAMIEPDLQEWDYGIYEGRKSEDIRKADPAWTIWTTQVTNGESIQEVGKRAERVIARATAAPGDVALFAHGHILRVIAACWLGLPPDAGRLFGLDTAAVSKLGYERETRVIRLWNRVLWNGD